MDARGFTLTELAVTLAIMAILAAVAVPAALDYRDGNRLRSAAETLAAFVQSGKQEAKRINAPLEVQLDAGPWCAGLDRVDADAGCDCTESSAGVHDACTLSASAGSVRRTLGRDFPGVTMSDITWNDGVTTLSPVRGTADPGSLRLTSASGEKALRLGVSAIGRVRLCVPSGAQGPGGYPPC